MQYRKEILAKYTNFIILYLFQEPDTPSEGREKMNKFKNLNLVQ